MKIKDTKLSGPLKDFLAKHQIETTEDLSEVTFEEWKNWKYARSVWTSEIWEVLGISFEMAAEQRHRKKQIMNLYIDAAVRETRDNLHVSEKICVKCGKEVVGVLNMSEKKAHVVSTDNECCKEIAEYMSEEFGRVIKSYETEAEKVDKRIREAKKAFMRTLEKSHPEDSSEDVARLVKMACNSGWNCCASIIEDFFNKKEGSDDSKNN